MNNSLPYFPPTITIVEILMEKGYQTSSVETPTEPISQFRLMMEIGEGQQQQQPFEEFNFHSGWGERGNQFFQ